MHLNTDINDVFPAGAVVQLDLDVAFADADGAVVPVYVAEDPEGFIGHEYVTWDEMTPDSPEDEAYLEFYRNRVGDSGDE